MLREFDVVGQKIASQALLKRDGIISSYGL
jgi:hypothetical protein